MTNSEVQTKKSSEKVFLANTDECIYKRRLEDLQVFLFEWFLKKYLGDSFEWY